ncbi:MAG: hypothetical protein JW929_16295 [Anaerolineales bacterium]|nr:hypothetical protein [Anaerolineales bacterium]
MQTQHTTQTKTNQIYSESGKVIGSVNGGVFRKSIAFSRHALRRPPALAVDECALLQAREAGAVEIRIRDSESGKVYSCPIPLFKEHAFILDRGFGKQYALLLSWWTIRDGEGLTLQRPPVERVKVEQLAMGF